MENPTIVGVDHGTKWAQHTKRFCPWRRGRGNSLGYTVGCAGLLLKFRLDWEFKVVLREALKTKYGVHDGDQGCARIVCERGWEYLWHYLSPSSPTVGREINEYIVSIVIMC